MAKTFSQFLNEDFKPFVFKNFEVSEAKSWDPDKFISHHANKRSKERFPNFTTATWVSLIKFAINKYGQEFIDAKDKDAPSGYVGYRSFALKFDHDGYEGWMTLRVRRHPAKRTPRRYNLMAITLLGPNMPPLKKHNDIIRKLPKTVSPKKPMAEAVEFDDDLLEEFQDNPVSLDDLNEKFVMKRRYTMPQIKEKDQKDFMKWARENYNVKFDQRRVSDLKKFIPTQKEYDKEKVMGMLKDRGWAKGGPIFVSGDNHIIDGHHRWHAAREAGGTMDVIFMKAPIEECLAVMKHYPKSFTKRLHENNPTNQQFVQDTDYDGEEDPTLDKKEEKDMKEAKTSNPIAKGMLQYKTGGGAHKKKKGKGSYDRKKNKRVSFKDF